MCIILRMLRVDEIEEEEEVIQNCFSTDNYSSINARLIERRVE